MSEIEVGRLYTIQALSADIGIGVRLMQDTVVEIKSIDRDKVTFWSSQTSEEHTSSLYALRMVV